LPIWKRTFALGDDRLPRAKRYIAAGEGYLDDATGRRRRERGAGLALASAPAQAQTPFPILVHDVKSGVDNLGQQQSSFGTKSRRPFRVR
jgi:hypothetical protein